VSSWVGERYRDLVATSADPTAAGGLTVAPPVTRWLGAPWADQAMVWAWVPFALLGAFLSDRVAAAVAVTYAFSYSHQLLTLPLVYGDGATFRSRRLVFTLAPVVVVVAVAVLWTEAFVALAIVGASWNVFHTLQQRYGLVRLYGRRVGQERPGCRALADLRRVRHGAHGGGGLAPARRPVPFGCARPG